MARALLAGFLGVLGLSLLGQAAPRKDAGALMAGATPAELSGRLASEPGKTAELLAPLGRALGGDDPELAREAGDYLAACARERGRALARQRSWSPGDVEALLAVQLVDPERFATDQAFRRRVVALLPRALDPGAPAGLRDALLQELNQVRGFDFAASEEVERAWGAVPRRASERRVGFSPVAQRFDADVEGRLAASVYSLPSFFFDESTADLFLSGARAAAPRRTLIVLTDAPLLGKLAPRAKALGIHLLNTHGRPYSPWPRDPFSLVHTREGSVRLLVRPNLQPGREEDANLGPELVQDLPEEIDRAWGKATWTQAPVPFHNGQILLTQAAAWVTLHALEPAILNLLGLDRVPVESFARPEGIDRYLAAAEQAARELGGLYGRSVRFVHPLPRAGSGDTALMRRIGGGAGYDLDSIVTLVPTGKNGRLAALVADVSLGRDLLAQLPAADLDALRRGYGLEPAGEPLAAALAAAQRTAGMDGLDDFLDSVAGHLATQGVEVRRLPILTVPVPLLTDRSGLSHAGFQITWNNVVVEAPKDGKVRAEGFSSLIPSGDARAREAFGALGVHLDLFPPLVRSVILNGGYRCASNHLRAAS
ncbi:MAG TPA: hypothetical protein VHC97_25110 [Thermoanaerobaculia bacterium]|nr:hypothetical protein [Thermoanaerobaculia bacterium]